MQFCYQYEENVLNISMDTLFPIIMIIFYTIEQ